MKYDKKTNVISVNGKPHALMLRTIATIGGINNNFSIQSMDGKELLYIKLKTKDRFNAFGNLVDSQTGYEIIFIERGKSVWKRNTPGFLTHTDTQTHTHTHTGARARTPKDKLPEE